MQTYFATPVMLRGIPFFKDLPEELLASIAPELHLKNCRQGTRLNPEETDEIYFIYQGVAAVYTLTKTGSRKILFFQGPGRLLSHSVMGTKPNMLFYEIMEDAILLSMDRVSFSHMLGRDPRLTEALLRHYENQLWRMGHQLKNTAGYLPMERKLAIKLWKLAQEFGVPVPGGTRIRFPLTVTQAADFLGAPRETVSRGLKRLSDWDLIQHHGRWFVIPSMKKLAEYCHSGTVN